MSTRDYGEALVGFGLPPEEVAAMTDIFDTLLDGRNAHVSEGVREVLGRAPRDFDGLRSGGGCGRDLEGVTRTRRFPVRGAGVPLTSRGAAGPPR